MRVVLATNVWLSGLLWTGTPHQLLRLVQAGAILATAIAAQADAIVTGDRDLLALTEFAGIPILTPQAIWEQLNLS